jgi:hypothetical protein
VEGTGNDYYSAIYSLNDMKTTILSLFVVLGLLGACQQNKPPDDPQLLKQVLFDYFDGLKNRDLNKMNSVTTNDFLLFEDGRVWNNDSLINALNKFSAFDVELKFDNFKINVDNTSGSMSYFNSCVCTFDTTKGDYEWIESATFRKIDEKWKMNFLHSTTRK